MSDAMQVSDVQRNECSGTISYTCSDGKRRSVTLAALASWPFSSWAPYFGVLE